MESFLKKFKIGEWNLGVSTQNFISLLGQASINNPIVLNVKWMKHKHSGSFFADPFILESNSTYSKILAEEYVYKLKKGVISIITIDNNTGMLIDKKIILEEQCHLSYPFYDKDKNIIIPESYRNSKFAAYDLFKSCRHNRTLVSEGLIDATLLHYNNLWWIFCTKKENALSDLHIYFSKNMYGPYMEHRLNPVKMDISSSRPAGKFFMYKGNLLRPVQDSTDSYGGGLKIMKVTKLSTSEFEEELFCDVKISNHPPYEDGFHTLNFDENIIIIDGYRNRFRPLFAIYIYKICPLLKKYL